MRQVNPETLITCRGFIDASGLTALLLALQAANPYLNGRTLLHFGLWFRDPNQVLCLGARNRMRFPIAGEGSLQDNLGTVSGSRVVELRNGRAKVTVSPRRARCVVSASTDGLPPRFCS